MTRIELLNAAKRSVAEAAYFDLDDACWCLAPHVCRAAGDTVVGRGVVTVNGMPVSVIDRAWSHLFTPEEQVEIEEVCALFHSSNNNSYPTHKLEAHARIDRVIEWLGRNAPKPEPVAVNEEELVLA